MSPARRRHGCRRCVLARDAPPPYGSHRAVQTFTDTVRYRFVLESLVSKNLKVMYRNQALGFVWAVV